MQMKLTDNLNRVIHWDDVDLRPFYRTWPCCDVPTPGWAEFDAKGDLVDISSNAKECDRGGGLTEFLDTLHTQQIKDNAPIYQRCYLLSIEREKTMYQIIDIQSGRVVATTDIHAVAWAWSTLPGIAISS